MSSGVEGLEKGWSAKAPVKRGQVPGLTVKIKESFSERGGESRGAC